MEQPTCRWSAPAQDRRELLGADARAAPVGGDEARIAVLSQGGAWAAAVSLVGSGYRVDVATLSDPGMEDML